MNQTGKKDMDLIFTCAARMISEAKTFPLTYTYGGKTYSALPAGTKKTWRVLDANMTETVYTGKVPGSEMTLRVECVTYKDYPVVEWTGYFTNDGEENSAILEDVWAADMTFSGNGAVLHHNNGDFYSADGYTQAETALPCGAAFTQAPSDGRACNEAWPYQRLMFDSWGLNIAIGWPAQWETVYEGKKDGVAFKARQQTVHTYLKPGETLRTPRMCIMAFEGDAERGMNLWRRWMNAHVTPRANGGMIEPKATVCENGPGEEFTELTDDLARTATETLKKWELGDQLLWWIDAGWYSCYVTPEVKRWMKTGTWEPDWAHFPNGMGTIGDMVHEQNIDYLIWYEPERVRPGTWLALRHPEWLLKANPLEWVKASLTDPGQYHPDNMMLNLADDECCDWLCKQYDALIKESGQDVYRQDFNFMPLSYWRSNEAEDRRGMLENKYQQNYLKFWDYLLENNPNLWIDSCSSGGRRNDLETMRRSVPLHPTDYGYGYHHINQAYRRTLHAWIPYTRSWTNDWLREDGETYAVGSECWNLPTRFTDFDMINGFGSIFPTMGVSLIEKMPGMAEHLKEMLKIWRKFADIQLCGDFYPLTEDHRTPEKWTVFQFDRPEEDKGAFQVLRNPQAKDETLTVYPKAICPCGEYELKNEQSGECYTMSGQEILDKGIAFAQPKASGAIWFYTKKN